MDCGQTQALFTAYQDRDLDPQSLLLFENHLATCPHCTREWDDFNELLLMLKAVPSLPAPPDLLPGIQARIGHRSFVQRLRRSFAEFSSPIPLAAGAGLAMVLLIILSGTFNLPGPGPEPAKLPETGIATSDAPSVYLPLNMIGLGIAGNEEPGEIHLLARTGFPSGNLPVHHTQGERQSIHPYYQYLNAREKNFPAGTYQWQHSGPADHNNPARKPQIGPPLMPDITIRVHRLSAGKDLENLHRLIQEAGNWQSRCYHHGYLLVLINPGELDTLYNLLQRQRLPFTLDAIREAGRSPHQPLLVAIRQ